MLTALLQHVRRPLCFADVFFLFAYLFLVDRTNGRAYATLLRLSSVVCDVM